MVTSQIIQQYGVIGNPISQSKSPLIHTYFATLTSQDMQYHKLLAPIDGFEVFVQNFIKSGGLGANVTVPFKEAAYRLCDELSNEAALAGAVNTLMFKEGIIYGDNTDGKGLINDLKNRHAINLTHKTILLVGAGGAARGILAPILSELPDRVIILNRTLARAEALREIFKDKSQDYQKIMAVDFDQFDDFMKSTGILVDIIINASSASLQGNIRPLPIQLFCKPKHLIVYDLMYQTGLTAFLKYCQSHGVVRLYDGLGMLVEQAALSFEIWRGIKPSTDEIYKKLKNS